MAVLYEIDLLWPPRGDATVTGDPDRHDPDQRLPADVCALVIRCPADVQYAAAGYDHLRLRSIRPGRALREADAGGVHRSTMVLCLFARWGLTRRACVGRQTPASLYSGAADSESAARPFSRWSSVNRLMMKVQMKSSRRVDSASQHRLRVISVSSPIACRFGHGSLSWRCGAARRQPTRAGR